MLFSSLQHKHNLKSQAERSPSKRNNQTDNIFTSFFSRSSKIGTSNLKNKDNEKISKTKTEFKFSQFPPNIIINPLEYIEIENRNLEGKSGYKISEGPELKGLYVGFLKENEKIKKNFKCLLDEEDVILHKFKFRKAQYEKVTQFLEKSQNKKDSIENTHNRSRFIEIAWISEVKENLFLSSNRKLLIITESYGESLENIIKKRQIGRKFYADYEILGFLNKSIEAINELHEKGIVHMGITTESWMIGQQGEYKLLYLGEHWEQNNEIVWNGESMSIRYVSPELKGCYEEFRDKGKTYKNNKINLNASDYYSLGIVVLEMMFLSRQSIENYRSLNQLTNLLSNRYAKSLAIVKSLLDENPEKRIPDKKTMDYLDKNGIKQLDMYFTDPPKKLRRINDNGHSSQTKSRFYPNHFPDIKSKIKLTFILKDFYQMQTIFRELEINSENDDSTSKLDKRKLYIMKSISERKLGLIKESNATLEKVRLIISKVDDNKKEFLTEIKYHQAKNDCLLGDLESAEIKIKEIWQLSNLEIKFSEYSLILFYSFFAKVKFLKNDCDSALKHIKFALKLIKNSINSADYHEKNYSLLHFKLTVYQQMFHFSKAFYINSKLLSRSVSLRHILISLFEQLLLAFQMNIEHNRKNLMERILKIFEERWKDIEKLRIDHLLNIFYNYSFLFKLFEPNDKTKIQQILEAYLETTQTFPFGTLSMRFSLFFKLTFAKAFYFLGNFENSFSFLKLIKKKGEIDFLIVEAIYFKESIECKLEQKTSQHYYKDSKSLLKAFRMEKNNLNGKINDYLITLEGNVLCKCNQTNYLAESLIEATSSNYLKSEHYFKLIIEIFENKRFFENNYISEAFFALKQEKYSGFLIHNFTIKLINLFLLNNLPQSAGIALELMRKNMEANNFGFEKKYMENLKTHGFDLLVDCELIFLEGLVSNCLNKTDAALKSFEKVYKILVKMKSKNMNKKMKVVLSLLNELNEKDGKLNQTKIWTDKILEIEPDNIFFLDKLAGLNSELGFYDKAIETSKQKKEINDFIDCCKLAELYLKIGDLKNFEEAYKSLEDCNFDGIHHFPLAYFLRLKGLYSCFLENYKAAENELEQCLEQFQFVFKKHDFIILSVQLLLYEIKIQLKQNINIKLESLQKFNNAHLSSQILLLQLKFSMNNDDDISSINKKVEDLEKIIDESNDQNFYHNVFFIKFGSLKFELHLKEGNLIAAEKELEKAINLYRKFCDDAMSHYVIIKMRNFLFRYKLNTLKIQKTIESMKQFQNLTEDEILKIVDSISNPEQQDKFLIACQQENNEMEFNNLLMEIKSNSIKINQKEFKKNDKFINVAMLERGIQENYEMAKKVFQPFFEKHPIILDAAKNIENMQLLSIF